MIGRLLERLVPALGRAFPARWRVIPRKEDGVPLLRQFKLTRRAYLQSFVSPEAPDSFHVHRWPRMVSLVLSGELEEERYPGGLFLRHAGPSLYTMDRTSIHRVNAVKPRTWTLFLMLGPTRPWGYYQRPASKEFTPWDEAIPGGRRVKSL